MIFSIISLLLKLLLFVAQYFQVVYVVAIFPYVLITILLIFSCTLDGAVDGIIFYLKPDFNKLLKNSG